MVTFDPIPCRGGPFNGQHYALAGGILPTEIELPCEWHRPTGAVTQRAAYSVETSLSIPVYLAFVGYRESE